MFMCCSSVVSCLLDWLQISSDIWGSIIFGGLLKLCDKRNWQKREVLYKQMSGFPRPAVASVSLHSCSIICMGQSVANRHFTYNTVACWPRVTRLISILYIAAVPSCGTADWNQEILQQKNKNTSTPGDRPTGSKQMQFRISWSLREHCTGAHHVYYAHHSASWEAATEFIYRGRYFFTLPFLALSLHKQSCKYCIDSWKNLNLVQKS